MHVANNPWVYREAREAGAARDHEPCERRVALWQHSAVSPRHGLRRCLASRATTAAPAGAPSAGHEHGPKARHEMKNSFLWRQLIDATDFVSFRVPRRRFSCLGALPEADRLARRNDAWRRPKAYKPLRRDTVHKTRSVVRQRAECSWSRVSAKHIYANICAMRKCHQFVGSLHKLLAAPLMEEISILAKMPIVYKWYNIRQSGK